MTRDPSLPLVSVVAGQAELLLSSLLESGCFADTSYPWSIRNDLENALSYVSQVRQEAEGYERNWEYEDSEEDDD